MDNIRVEPSPMLHSTTPPPGPENGATVGALPEAFLAAAGEPPATVDLELPLDDSFAMLVRLAIGDLAREAGFGAEQIAAARDEASELFTDLCRSVNHTGSARLRFEFIPGALKVVARPSAKPSEVAVRAWAPVPDVA
jgi:hypothetical protein